MSQHIDHNTIHRVRKAPAPSTSWWLVPKDQFSQQQRIEQRRMQGSTVLELQQSAPTDYSRRDAGRVR